LIEQDTILQTKLHRPLKIPISFQLPEYFETLLKVILAEATDHMVKNKPTPPSDLVGGNFPELPLGLY